MRVSTLALARFLSVQLPKLSDDWWVKLVFDRLSFQQQRLAQERDLERLEQLDLAALLRVLDKNWYELSSELNLPREGRNWVKELQTIRNKWAHMPAEEPPASEVYRDADTLERLLKMIDADQASIQTVQDAKTTSLAKMTTGANNTMASNFASTAKNMDSANNTPTHLFNVGDIVALRSNKSTKLPVTDVVTNGPEVRYVVFQDGAKTTYYESQLEATASDADERPSISVDEFRARVTSLHLLSQSTANLFSLRSGRINFVPYQYRPVLKLIRSDVPRLLIADEVGVGKTIEAGLILKELRARMDISSVLIICPKALVAERKWQTEMKRFEEDFVHLEGPLLRHCLHETELEGEWPEKYKKAILPFSLFNSELVHGSERKNAHGLVTLDPPPSFDLVIVDEAHHIRNSETFLHQGIRYFCDNAHAVLLMTATPVQFGSNDLFTLLNVLRPDLIIDRNSFEQMAEPNRFINEAIRLCRKEETKWQENAMAQLREAARTEWGRLFLREGPAFQTVFDALQETEISDVERVSLTRKLESLYTFGSIINRTRRRDIGEFTSRRPQTLTVEFTEEQRALHDDLLCVIARILARCHGQRNVKFLMTTIRRQAASCIYGLMPLLSDILNSNLDRLEMIESIDTDDDLDLSFVEGIRAEIEAIIARTKYLDPKDPKIEAFVQTLKDKNSFKNNKALVFSTFRHTLTYLARHTEAAGLRFGLIQGDVSDEERRMLRKRFSLPKDDEDAIDILLSSEVGCEGLDFQFCDFLVNYDIPWNPMRVEQRIGRIDRYGQKSETVSIVNLITLGTVDAEIYERCLMRIGVFQHAVGGSEEILGQITREIHDIADSFELTDEQRSARLKQLEYNKIRRFHEEQELEENEAELFGLNVPKASWREDIETAESVWLSPSAIHGLVATYLKAITCSDSSHLLGEKPLKTLRLAQEARNALLGDFMELKRSKDPVSRKWENWLRGGRPSIAVSFDQETASENPNAVYLSILHPLVRKAARYLETNEVTHCTLQVSKGFPVGEHRFALYRWKMLGIKLDERLVVVADDPAIEADLMSMLNKAVEPIEPYQVSSTDFDDLDSLHHAKWKAAQADYIAANRELAEHRMQSLTASHRARVHALEDQLSKVTNEKIRIMKQSEIARANSDFDRRVAELHLAGNAGDIQSEPVLLGTVRCLKETDG